MDFTADRVVDGRIIVNLFTFIYFLPNFSLLFSVAVVFDLDASSGLW